MYKDEYKIFDYLLAYSWLHDSDFFLLSWGLKFWISMANIQWWCLLWKEVNIILLGYGTSWCYRGYPRWSRNETSAIVAVAWLSCLIAVGSCTCCVSNVQSIFSLPVNKNLITHSVVIPLFPYSPFCRLTLATANLTHYKNIRVFSEKKTI